MQGETNTSSRDSIDAHSVPDHAKERWRGEIAKLENRLANCNSDTECIELLDKFLEKKSSELRKFTLKGNENAAMSQWSALLECVAPLYTRYGGSISSESQNFTL